MRRDRCAQRLRTWAYFEASEIAAVVIIRTTGRLLGRIVLEAGQQLDRRVAGQLEFVVVAEEPGTHDARGQERVDLKCEPARPVAVHVGSRSAYEQFAFEQLQPRPLEFTDSVGDRALAAGVLGGGRDEETTAGEHP